MSKPSELELRVREEQRDFLKSNATQYRRQAMRHAYSNATRYNELVREARKFDLCAELICPTVSEVDGE